MKTGRRGFFKALAAIAGGIAVSRLPVLPSAATGTAAVSSMRLSHFAAYDAAMRAAALAIQREEDEMIFAAINRAVSV